ncbi:MATE family efflux transporter [Novosphingobium pentaromativorans]|uniref:MATE efflux family protein n=1 Tax=Novosphingobium pentaromativorans US6-1 TaxID=1088721 RepID=G6E8L2_9SPHN|nr:multidrug transporter MatE [Novosphingobium pentaromativorans US6-1]EHJ62086.1 MATE efflux family protein [Novosphingobium pentaromativorans US6-1]
MEAEALAEGAPGKHERGDLTQGPILRTLLLFSVPMLLSNVLQTLNGSINTIWVGRLLGESALAATANANLVMFLVIAATIGLGMATTVRISQRFGARDLQAVRATFGTGLGLCMALAAVTGTLGWFFSPALLHALGTPQASVQEALSYLRVIFVTVPFGVMSMIISMALRGVGDSKTPLNAMILTVMLDIVLNPLLIMGLGPVPSLGIAGSAMATAFANFSGTMFQIRQIYRKDLPLRLRGAELRYVIPRREELGYIITKGLPMGTQMLLFSSAGVIMIGLVNREGLNAAAAYGASLQLWNYLQMPALAVGSAVSAMVAQSLGAGNHARVGQVTRAGMLCNLVMTTALGAIIVLADHPLLALFLGSDSPAMPIAERIQLICTCAFLFMSVTMILSGTMRAYGAVVGPLVIMAVALYPARLGFYYALYPKIGGDAVWWAFPVGGLTSLLLTFAYYSKGNWRRAFKG